MAPEFERNRQDAEQVLDYIQIGESDQEEYGEVKVAVHPGFCLEEDRYSSVQGLRPEDYFRHTIEVHRELGEAMENEVAVDVVYRSGMEDEALRYLGELTDGLDNFYKSSHGSGFVRSEEGKEGLAETFEKVEDCGKISLYGEINGLCLTQFEDLIRS